MPCLIAGSRPLPHVADHVDQTEAIAWERSDRRGADPTVGTSVLVREPPLPGVRHQLPGRLDLLAPGVRGSAAGSRRVLPLGLVREATTRPCRVRLSVRIGDLYHRVVGLVTDIGVRPNGCRQLAPIDQRHHRRQSLRSTGPDVAANTRAPGSRSSAAKSGNSAGSSGRSATVTYPVSATNCENCPLVTGCCSIAKGSTYRSWIGPSSG
jgi:hypothetical protein